jgi:hypothetical protein
MLPRVTTPQNVRAIQMPSKVASNDRFKEFRMNLLEAMDKKDPAKAMEKICRAENRKFRKQFDSMTTLRRYYTHYRNVCREVISKKKDRYILETCLEILNLTRQEIDDLNDQYSQKVATEHRSLRPLKNYDQMILKAVDLLGGMSIYDRILGLACLTGRRAAEIGCTAKFQKLRENWMLFDGQLKGKTRLLHTYEIPVLADGALIIEAVRSIHEQRPHWVDNTLSFSMIVVLGSFPCALKGISQNLSTTPPSRTYEPPMPKSAMTSLARLEKLRRGFFPRF